MKMGRPGRQTNNNNERASVSLRGGRWRRCSSAAASATAATATIWASLLMTGARLRSENLSGKTPCGGGPRIPAPPSRGRIFWNPPPLRKFSMKKCQRRRVPERNGAAKHLPTIATLLEPRRLGGLPTGIEKQKPHKHELSEVRADFVDRRWIPLAAPPAPPLARSARQGGPKGLPGRIGCSAMGGDK